jgi:hypothetical protein
VTGPATTKLMAYMDHVEPWDYDAGELEPVWVEAINERLVECRGSVKVLDRILEATGIDTVDSLKQVVPLLFPHSVYKSYPETFVRKGAWDRMSSWVDTLAKYRVEGIDHEGIEDVDGWMARLHEAGHFVFATSGTTGKHSYLDMSALDLETIALSQFPRGVPADQSWAVFVCGPRTAPSKAAMYFRAFAERFGHPDKTYFMSHEPMRMADLTKAAELRKAMADGTATPGAIAAFERETREKQARADTDELVMAKALLELRTERVMLVGLLPAMFRLAKQVKALGFPNGGLHPDSYISVGGGSKGTDIPADWRQQLEELFGVEVQLRYGFQETNGGARLLNDGLYHFPAWKIPLVLDDSGEHLLEPRSGVVTGRLGAFDVSVDGRWGGVITGDQVVAHYDAAPGFGVESKIERYSAMQGGDDKLSCSGTFDAFVRGFVQ